MDDVRWTGKTDILVRERAKLTKMMQEDARGHSKMTGGGRMQGGHAQWWVDSNSTQDVGVSE